MNSLSNNSVRGLVEVFRDEGPVLVVYLFGSKSRGEQTSQSDTDIAVLLSKLPDKLLDFYLRLIDKLSKVLGDSIDLIFLNTVAPLLQHQVIKYGRIIYCRDEKARVEFEARAEKEYMDFNRSRERYNEALIEEVSTWKG
mgnify:CR=1 FL=1